MDKYVITCRGVLKGSTGRGLPRPVELYKYNVWDRAFHRSFNYTCHFDSYLEALITLKDLKSRDTLAYGTMGRLYLATDECSVEIIDLRSYIEEALSCG